MTIRDYYKGFLGLTRAYCEDLGQHGFGVYRALTDCQVREKMGLAWSHSE